MITFTVSAVAGALFAAVVFVAALPGWDRDRAPRRPAARHVRVPLADLIGGPQ